MITTRKTRTVEGPEADLQWQDAPKEDRRGGDRDRGPRDARIRREVAVARDRATTEGADREPPLERGMVTETGDATRVDMVDRGTRTPNKTVASTSAIYRTMSSGPILKTLCDLVFPLS